MKTITVRGVDATLAEKLKKTARNERKSVNQLVLDSIRHRLGEGKEKRFNVVFHDMDHLFGKWTDTEFKRIQGRIDAERKIDKELWK
jgi:hypothetical protein